MSKSDNRKTIDARAQIFRRDNIACYTVAHASKFVRPGSLRIASNEGPLSSVALLALGRDKVLIVANDSDSPQQFQIHFHGKTLNIALTAGSVSIYVRK